jgi:pimeloyl-ACP methyl ester carboxylesterase
MTRVARCWIACLLLCVACNLDVALPSAPVALDVDLGELEIGGEILMEGAGVGADCDAPGQCRRGLSCSEGLCQPAQSLELGDPCLLAAECVTGATCSHEGVCVTAGVGVAGDVCSGAADCEETHYCLMTSLVGVCAPAGGGAIDAACDDRGDCLAGLACRDGVCAPASPLYGAPIFPGVDCASEVEGPARVLFEVPRGGVTPAEFYRLPFPNDIRLRNGRVDLSGHAAPGDGLLGVDLVARLIDAIELDMTGFGTNATVFFRTTVQIDFESVVADGDVKTVLLYDVTPESPDYGRDLGMGWFATTGRGKYICENSLTLHRPWSRPLRPATTYAALVTRGVRGVGDDGGRLTLQPDTDFSAMLAADSPVDPDLASAYEVYAPLRAFIEAQALDVEELIGGALFTTADVRGDMARVASTASSLSVDAGVSWTPCDGGAASPCDDGLSGPAHVRGCFEPAATFHELHGRLRLPVIQKGERPYLDPEDGGAPIAEGEAWAVQGQEDVCTALTIPAELPMPEAGWPVVVYAHGTGGSLRSAVTNGVIEALSRIELEGDAPRGFAVLAIDQVMHGARRGSERLPEELVYNFRNPRAARGNFLQAALDNLALAEIAAALEVPADASPTGEALRFDPAHVYFFGHSQGGTSGPLSMPYAARYPAAVYSGAGGGLANSLVEKTSPTVVLDGLRVALQEREVGATHPVVSLIQQYFDAVDPLNFAALQAAEPLEGRDRHSILHIYGLEDSYTPPSTIRTLAAAMYGALAEPVHVTIAGLTPASPPIKGNLGGQTVVTAEYAPDGYDGHFVAFRHASARAHWVRFLVSALRDGVPTFQ